MTPPPPNNSTRWADELLIWYDRQARKLPWRETPSPYHVWTSEIMLQQTRVDTVIPYFERWVGHYPTVEALAQADQQEVLKLWEGLGYYSRARNFHKAAREVVDDHAGCVPQSYETLQTLPGVGSYTAAAIASIAYGEPVPVVDGNVLRVFTRFWGITEDIRNARVKKELFARLLPVIEQRDPSRFNQAIMELGALVCQPRKPRCDDCPLKPDCYAFQENQQQHLPVKSKKRAVPHKEIAVGVIWKEGRILIGRRRTDQMLGGLWEFPGGKKQSDESLEETALREIREETGLEVSIEKSCCTVKHAYSHFKITLTAFHCKWISGVPRPNSTDELRWVSVDQLERFPFPAANKRIIEAIRSPSASWPGS